MKKKYKEIADCEVCGEKLLSPVALNLGNHALCDDLVKIGSTRKCLEYPIEIYYCINCRTAHQRYQVPKAELFKSTYHYRARFTADVINGMGDLVQSCQEKFGSLSKKKVIDIGCNDGSLLNIFRDAGGITVGIEPTEACEEARASGHRVYKDFLSKDLASQIVQQNGKQDFITFTNVFAHIEDLKGVLEAVSELMHPSSILIVENHYLGAVLKGNQFDTFYHEHPRTYSYRSFEWIAKSLGLVVLGVEYPERYGGNIRVFMGPHNLSKLSEKDISLIEDDELMFGDLFVKLAGDVSRWRVEKRKHLVGLAMKHGRIQAKAFPGRAAILFKLLDLNEEIIEGVYEKPGSLKIGNYVPGTKIPILSDDSLNLNSSSPLINMAWHIPKEIRGYLKGIGYRGEVEDILSPQDFG